MSEKRQSFWLSRAAYFLLGWLVSFLLFWVITYQLENSFTPNVILTVNGADVSHRGGSKLRLDYGEVQWTQICRGECDDVSTVGEKGEYGMSVNVINKDGKCLVCDEGVANLGAGTDHLSISGREKLKFSSRFVPAP